MPEGESTRRSRRTNLGQPPRRLVAGEGTLAQGANRTARFREEEDEIVENRIAQVDMNQGQGGAPPQENNPNVPNNPAQAAANNAGQALDPQLRTAIANEIAIAIGPLMQLIQGQQQPPQAQQQQPLPPPAQNLPVPQPAAAAIHQPQLVMASMSTFPQGTDPMIDPKDPVHGRLNRSMYNEAKEELKTKIDGKNLTLVISELRERCSAINCIDLFNVATTSGTKNLLMRYGEITIQDVRQEATQRWTLANWHTQARYLIGICLLRSMTEAFKLRMAQKRNLYNMTNDQPDGPLIFKVMCDVVQPSTRNTTQHLVHRLQTMRPREFGNDIVQFNEKFTSLTEQIRAQQGGSNSLTEELLYNALVLAYDSVDQDQFKAFMGVKNNSSVQPHEDLMSEADAKFQDLHERRIWNVPSQSQQILSLKTLVSKTEKKAGDAMRQLDRSKQPRKDSRSKRKTSTPTVDDVSETARKKRQTDFDQWMLTKPKKGEENTVVQKKGPNGQVKGWNWCDKHEKMVLAIGRDGRPHSSDTCALGKRSPTSNPRKKSKKQLRVKALQAEIRALENNSETHANESDGTDGFRTSDEQDSDSSKDS
jgi:hypothetical protein